LGPNDPRFPSTLETWTCICDELAVEAAPSRINPIVTPRQFRNACVGLIIAATGGVLFWLAGLPAPWLAGSMVASTAAALMGAPHHIPRLGRQAVYVLIGAQIGASFTPQAFESMAQWPVSLGILALTVIGVTWAGYLFYWKACGWDRASAFFASCPGAFAVMLILAERERANVPQVTVVQSIRVFFLVLVLPVLITALSGDVVAVVVEEDSAGLWDAVLMLLAAAGGGLLAERLRMPAGLVLGAVPPVAALELTGVVTGQLPDWILVPGFILLGLIIGARFAGFTLALLRDLFVLGLVGFVLSLALSAAGALTASALTGISPMSALVAFAPGGLEAMSIMAFALNLDPAFVGTHQIARYIGLAAFLPAIVLLLRRRWSPDRDLDRGD